LFFFIFLLDNLEEKNKIIEKDVSPVQPPKKVMTLSEKKN
jgi:hypothetical protein